MYVHVRMYLYDDINIIFEWYVYVKSMLQSICMNVICMPHVKYFMTTVKAINDYIYKDFEWRRGNN